MLTLLGVLRCIGNLPLRVDAQSFLRTIRLSLVRPPTRRRARFVCLSALFIMACLWSFRMRKKMDARIATEDNALRTCSDVGVSDGPADCGWRRGNDRVRRCCDICGELWAARTGQALLQADVDEIRFAMKLWRGLDRKAGSSTGQLAAAAAVPACQARLVQAACLAEARLHVGNTERLQAKGPCASACVAWRPATSWRPGDIWQATWRIVTRPGRAIAGF